LHVTDENVPEPLLVQVTVPVGEFPLTVALHFVAIPTLSGEAMQRIVVGSWITTANGSLVEELDGGSARGPAASGYLKAQTTSLPVVTDPEAELNPLSPAVALLTRESN
jgi:hypothetical protein